MYKNIDEICRVCLKYGNLSLFDSSQYNIHLMKIASVQIHPSDGYPTVICFECVQILESACDFRKKVEETDLELRKNKSKESNVKYKNVEQPSIEINDSENIALLISNEIIKEEAPKNYIDLLVTSNTALLKTNNTLVVGYSEQNKSSKKDKDFIEAESNELTSRSYRKKKLLSIEPAAEQTVLHSNIKHSVEYKSKRNQTRKHMCHTCGKTFIYQSNLNDHIRIHSGSKPFICSVCGRGFAQTGHLLVHARSHSGDKPYKCEICERSFSIRQGLKKHSRTHTGERPYPCNACSKTFVTSYHLSNHFKRHTGEKNFKCDFTGCALSFVNISEMKRHRIRHEKHQNQHKISIHQTPQSNS